MRQLYIKRAQSFVVVYSVTSRSSFVSAQDLIRQIQYEKKYASVPIILVGSKSDMETSRAVSAAEGGAMAKRLRARFVEASSRDGTNVEKAFYDLARWTPWNGQDIQVLVTGCIGHGAWAGRKRNACVSLISVQERLRLSRGSLREDSSKNTSNLTICRAR